MLLPSLNGTACWTVPLPNVFSPIKSYPSPSFNAPAKISEAEALPLSINTEIDMVFSLSVP